LIKIGAKVVGHARYIAFQMAEVAIPCIFADILRMIAELRPPPVTSTGVVHSLCRESGPKQPERCASMEGNALFFRFTNPSRRPDNDRGPTTSAWAWVPAFILNVGLHVTYTSSRDDYAGATIKCIITVICNFNLLSPQFCPGR
jgi:hypothetical protein